MVIQCELSSFLCQNRGQFGNMMKMCYNFADTVNQL